GLGLGSTTQDSLCNPRGGCWNAKTTWVAASKTGGSFFCGDRADTGVGDASGDGGGESRSHCIAQRSGEDARRDNTSRGHLTTESGRKVSRVAGAHAV